MVHTADSGDEGHRQGRRVVQIWRAARELRLLPHEVWHNAVHDPGLHKSTVSMLDINAQLVTWCTKSFIKATAMALPSLSFETTSDAYANLSPTEAPPA